MISKMLGARMGPKGRKALVDSWAQYLPLYTQSEIINQQAVTQPVQNHVNNNSGQLSTPDPQVSRMMPVLLLKY